MRGVTFEELRDKARALPLKPGVYLMQNAGSEIIYVGKAKALKNRVSQYFQDQSRHNEKTRAMVSQIDHFDVIVVQSEFEALVLECALIKRHQPRYNILLKDDKGYPLVRLSLEQRYPRFSLAARAAEDGARYFGPFGSRGATLSMLDALLAALRLPTCRRKFPRDIGRERPCLNYHMGRCDGYCRPDMDEACYREAMARAVRVLEGRVDEVVQELAGEMEQAAEELRFERAAQRRDQIRAIELLSKRQKAVAGVLADTDVIGWYRGEVKSCFTVLHYVGGELAAKDFRVLDTPMEEGREETLSAVAVQFYTGRGQLPRRILLPCGLEQQEDLERLLSQQAGRKVELAVPQRGAKLDMVKMANENAAEEAIRVTTAEERRSRLMEALGALLGLDDAPRRIEAFDISNTGSADIVASMTVHMDGKPLKRDYRRFKLKGLAHADDYASMEQVVERRFARYLGGDEKFSALPDLLLIDGGAGQVAAAERAMARMGISVPAFGMVKDDRHRTRALVDSAGREIGIRQNQAIFSFVGRIQEETHRFAIEFHRQQQAGHLKGSQLDAIPGVGPARRAALLKRFKSVRAVRGATLEELEQVLPAKTAQAVYRYFQEESSAGT